CFLLPASCFLLPASCFLLPASCFLLISLMGRALLSFTPYSHYLQQLGLTVRIWPPGAICADCADMEGACLVDVMWRRESGL
ncbi:hypothetical protein, partial [Aeromonas veronii]|uniref:hypothetical protein n=1 Tax=Aeromonas veronii TaxID=654 RepID=UPI003B9FA95F